MEKKILLIDKKLEDLNDFFEAFGSLNSSNIATLVIDRYSERKIEKHQLLSENLFYLESQVLDCNKEFQRLDEEAILEECPCTQV